MKYAIEHVFSKNLESKIFKDILNHFKIFGSTFEHSSDLERLAMEDAVCDDEASQELEPTESRAADFRIYHRPQLEEELIQPCACVVHHDLNDPSDAFELQKFVDRYKQANLVICINKTQAEVLKTHGVENTIVIHHGFDTRLLENLRVERRQFDGKFKLGLFSRRYGRLVKGEAFLYDLAIRLSPDTFEFMLAGEGRHVDANWLRSIGFDVTFSEHPPYSVLCAAYRDIDALLILSVSEGGPASVPESLASGVPIIARAVGMVPEMFDIGPCGLMLSDNSQKDARDIAKFLNEDAGGVRTSLKENKFVYTWEEVVKKYEDCIIEFVGD